MSKQPGELSKFIYYACNCQGWHADKRVSFKRNESRQKGRNRVKSSRHYRPIFILRRRRETMRVSREIKVIHSPEVLNLRLKMNLSKLNNSKRKGAVQVNGS